MATLANAFIHIFAQTNFDELPSNEQEASKAMTNISKSTVFLKRDIKDCSMTYSVIGQNIMQKRKIQDDFAAVTTKTTLIRQASQLRRNRKSNFKAIMTSNLSDKGIRISVL